MTIAMMIADVAGGFGALERKNAMMMIAAIAEVSVMAVAATTITMREKVTMTKRKWMTTVSVAGGFGGLKLRTF